MAGKGPLIIIFFGIGTMIFFGMVANWLLENNPVIQKVANYKRSVEVEFSARQVELSHKGTKYTLELWLQADDLGDGGAKDTLPARFASLERHFVSGAELIPRPTFLEVVLHRAGGWGCRYGADPVHAQSFDLEGDRRLLMGNLARSLGARVTDIVIEEDRVRASGTGTRGVPEGLGEAGRLLSGYLGGGWGELEIRLGAKQYHFDGSGQPRQP